MGYLLAFMSALCFSVTNIILKKGMAHTQDNGVWLITMINAVLLGIVCLFYLLVADSLSVNLTAILLFALAGLLINIVGRILLYSGIRQIGSSKAVAIKNSAPIFTLLFAILVIQEQIPFWPWIGLIFILIGLFMLGLQLFREGNGQGQRTGYIIALCSAIGFGIGQAISKLGLYYMNQPLLGVAIGTATACFCLTVYELKKRRLLAMVRHIIYQPNWYYIWSGVLTSLALLFFYLSISYIHVSYAVAILAVDPILTVLLSKRLLKKEESISGLLVIVAILIFLGAGIITLTEI